MNTRTDIEKAYDKVRIAIKELVEVLVDSDDKLENVLAELVKDPACECGKDRKTGAGAQEGGKGTGEPYPVRHDDLCADGFRVTGEIRAAVGIVCKPGARRRGDGRQYRQKPDYPRGGAAGERGVAQDEPAGQFPAERADTGRDQPGADHRAQGSGGRVCRDDRGCA